MKGKLVAVLLALAGMLAVAAPAGAADIHVTSFTDDYNEPANSGTCSLREAVSSANTNTPFGGCTTGDGGDDIVALPAGNYTLSRTGTETGDVNSVNDLDVTSLYVKIHGDTTTTPVTISASTLGDRAVEVSSTGTLSMFRVRVTGGHATGNGGAVAAANSLQLTSVTFDDNHATGDGGAVYFNAALTTFSMAAVTMTGNSANGSGGALYFNSNAVAPSLNGNTIVENVSDGDESGNGQGGGIYKNGTASMTMSNTILAGNTQLGEEQGQSNCAGGTINSGGHNLIGSNVGCNVSLLAGGEDLVGSPANLGNLIPDGTVYVRRLTPLSPAVNRGYLAVTGVQCDNLDARGAFHAQEGRCDIGAVELGARDTQFLDLTTFADDYNSGSFAGTCGLREAITAANTNQTFGGCPAGTGGTGYDYVRPVPGTYELTRSGADDTNVLGDLDLNTAHLYVLGNGTGQITIDGTGGGDRVFDVAAGTTGMLISGANIQGGSTPGDGGGVRVQGELALSNAALTGNEAGGQGGGAYFNGGANGAKLTNVTVHGNESGNYGAGLFSSDSFGPQVNNSTITGNTSAGGGGGIAGFNGFQIANTIIAGNIDSSGGDAPDCHRLGAGTSQGHNIVGDGSNCQATAAAGDQIGTSGAPIDPLLGPFADNGGRSLTRLPLFGSPALNAGNELPFMALPGIPYCEVSDQRDAQRPDPIGSPCDVGAAESNPADPNPPGGDPGNQAPGGPGPGGAVATPPKKCPKGKKLKKGKCKKKKKKRRKK